MPHTRYRTLVKGLYWCTGPPSHLYAARKAAVAASPANLPPVQHSTADPHATLSHHFSSDPRNSPGLCAAAQSRPPCPSPPGSAGRGAAWPPPPQWGPAASDCRPWSQTGTPRGPAGMCECSTLIFCAKQAQEGVRRALSSPGGCSNSRLQHFAAAATKGIVERALPSLRPSTVLRWPEGAISIILW